MAQLRLQPPEPFNFKDPDDWPRWKRRFTQFRTASGLVDESDDKQVSTLLYCLGEEAESVLRSTNATERERGVYETVLQKFDDFFKVRNNIIFERARFNRRGQLQGETAEKYIMALYALAERCDYGGMTEQLIRDRLVVGIRDSALSEKLQLDPKLTLDSAKKAIRQREAVKEQQQALKGFGESSSLEAVQRGTGMGRGRRRQPPQHQRSYQGGKHKGQKHAPGASKQCTRCGKGQHPREKCPARDATCHKCQRKGHYSAYCYTKSIGGLYEEDEDDDLTDSFMDTAFMDTLSSGTDKAWFVSVQLGSMEARFKIDTGAEVTAVSPDTHERVGKPPLHTPDKALLGPSRHPLQVQGQFQCDLTYQGRTSRQQVFVVKGLQNNLLGLPAITSLNLAARMDVTSTSDKGQESVNFMERFPKAFEGLGNLGEEYDIQLKPDAQPHALTTPRHVPLPLRQKVADELARMESMGIISKVEQPTPWCAGMVPVLKRSGAIRICVDLKPLNQNVLREVHPLPRVDDTLAQLKGAKLFSKLDANSGFWKYPCPNALDF